MDSIDRQHALDGPIRRAISEVVDGDIDLIVQRIMQELGQLGLIDYAPKGTIKLLTPAGRALVALMERPGMTMRELSLYMGTTEANVLKQVTALVNAGVIARTKSKGRNKYRLNSDTVEKHPDITRFFSAIYSTFSQTPKTSE